MESDYTKYRGKCKEMAKEAVSLDPSLKLVRGFYHCPLWGKQQHWWTVRQNGDIYDPSCRQFPTKGAGAFYEEFDGMIECDYCGEKVPENRARFDGSYVYCGYDCNVKSVLG